MPNHANSPIESPPAPGGGRRIVIAGGSGFLGHSLAAHLHALGCHVTVLSRKPLPPGTPWQHQRWDARTLGTEGTTDDWAHVLDGAFGLVSVHT